MNNVSEMTADELVHAAGIGQGVAPNVRDRAQAQLLVRLAEAVHAQTASTEASSATMEKLTRGIFWLTVTLTVLGVVSIVVGVVVPLTT